MNFDASGADAGKNDKAYKYVNIQLLSHTFNTDNKFY